MKNDWTIQNLANNGMRYSKFPSESEAITAARDRAKSGEIERISQSEQVVYFIGLVRL